VRGLFEVPSPQYRIKVAAQLAPLKQYSPKCRIRYCDEAAPKAVEINYFFNLNQDLVGVGTFLSHEKYKGIMLKMILNKSDILHS
jgi:hypothetical protein